MTLVEYTQGFMVEVLRYRSIIVRLKDVAPGNKVLDDILNRLNEEYQSDKIISFSTPEDYLANDWVKFQVILSFYFSKKFYPEDHIMSLSEYMDIRDTIEHVLINQRSDQSVYTRMINYFQIPLDLIPKQFLNDIISTDEFTHGSNFILEKVSKIPPPKDFVTLDSYREHIGIEVDSMCQELYDMGYFGTHDREYMIDLIVGHKFGFMFGNFYISPKILVKKMTYEELKDNVERIWSKRDAEAI